MTKKFKHSGTLGDLVYSLPIMRALGGGEFYLHLNQVDWIGQYYYGSKPTPFHQGRMNQQDFDFMRDFMLAQDYITRFEALDPQATEITHNLDRFRPAFVSHPGNYVDIYAHSFGFPKDQWAGLRQTPWLTVPKKTTPQSVSYVINRTQRWLPSTNSYLWNQWREQGVPETSVFVGLPEEHRAFEASTGWKIEYLPTKNMLELAQVIAGAEQFIGNQSVALSLAIGLGVPYACEARDDMPLERNECYFPEQGDYF